MKTVLEKEIKLDPGFWTKTSQIQLFYGLWVNLCHLGVGLAFGLPSVQVPQLSAGDSFIKVTRNEASWIGEIYSSFFITYVTLGIVNIKLRVSTYLVSSTFGAFSWWIINKHLYENQTFQYTNYTSSKNHTYTVSHVDFVAK